MRLLGAILGLQTARYGARVRTIIGQLSPSRRDLILMTGVAAAGAVATAQRGQPSPPPPASLSTSVLNVRDFGATGDDSSDDSGAVQAAMKEAQASRAPATIYFPAGEYRVRGGVIVVDEGTPLLIRGDGAGATRISFLAGDTSSDPLVSVNAAYSAVEALRLDGGGARNGAALLALNQAYTRVDGCVLTHAPGTALAIGESGPALVHAIENVIIRDAGQYGIHVFGTVAGHAGGSTDGLWSNVDVGRSGLSGVFLESSSQNLSNVHVWQSGTDRNAGDDRHGFRVTSRSHILNGCQAETNLGDGIRFENGGGDHSVVSAGRVWQNGGSGLVGINTHFLTITGCSFTQNGRANVGDAASKSATSAAAIRNEGGGGWAITGCSAWDDEQPLKEVKSPAPTDGATIPSRGKQRTQTFAYVSTGKADDSVLTGGVCCAEDTLSGASILSESTRLRVCGTDLGADTVPQISTMATLTLPPWGSTVRLAGAGQISRIEPSYAGRVVNVLLPAGATVTISAKNPALLLAADLTASGGGCITLVCSGDVWHEISRTA